MSYLGNMNFFWFLCGLIPLGWAVVFVLVAGWLAWGLWLHVRVESADGDRVRMHIPLPPFGLAKWALRLVGRFVPRLRKSALDEVLESVQGEFKRGEHMVINVDDEGDRVQVVIG
jgi:H+/Cl- antiporter ClcA